MTRHELEHSKHSASLVRWAWHAEPYVFATGVVNILVCGLGLATSYGLTVTSAVCAILGIVCIAVALFEGESWRKLYTPLRPKLPRARARLK